MLHIFTLLGHTRLSLLKEHARIMPLECTNSRTCEGGVWAGPFTAYTKIST